MTKRLDGKVAIVTGGAGGIGRALVLALANEGAKVVVNDPGSSVRGEGQDTKRADAVVDEVKAQGGTAVASYDSVSLFDGGRKIVQRALDSFGRLDILVTPHGIVRDRMVFNMGEEEWDEVLNVHLKGTFNIVRHASPVMIKQRSGRIITVTSRAGLMGNTGQVNYASAKDAIAGFTMAIAAELKPYGITCNALSPNARTRMMAVAEEGPSSKDARGAGFRPTTSRLIGEPEDVAPLVVWLCSDAAAHVTGQILFSGGPLVAAMSRPEPVKVVAQNGVWSFEDLALVFPATLGVDLVNPAPPQPAPPAPSAAQPQPAKG